MTVVDVVVDVPARGLALCAQCFTCLPSRFEKGGEDGEGRRAEGPQFQFQERRMEEVFFFFLEKQPRNSTWQAGRDDGRTDGRTETRRREEAFFRKEEREDKNLSLSAHSPPFFFLFISSSFLLPPGESFQFAPRVDCLLGWFPPNAVRTREAEGRK